MPPVTDAALTLALLRLRDWLATRDMLGLPPAQMVTDLRTAVQRLTKQGAGR